MDSSYITQVKSLYHEDDPEAHLFDVKCPKLNLSAIDYGRHSKVHYKASHNTIEGFNRLLNDIQLKEHRWKEAQKQLLKDFQLKNKKFEVKRQRVNQILKKKYLTELQREAISKKLRQQDEERRKQKSRSLNTSHKSKPSESRSPKKDMQDISNSLQLFDDKLERASERATSRRKERVESMARRSLTVIQVRERANSKNELQEQESLIKLQKLHDDLKKHRDSREEILNKTVSRLSVRNRNITEERLRSIRNTEELNRRRAESRLNSKDQMIQSKIKIIRRRLEVNTHNKQKKRKERLNTISTNQHQNSKLLGNLRDKILNRYAENKSKHQSMVQEREEMAWERHRAYKQFLNIRAEIRMKEEKILNQLLLKHNNKNKSFHL